MSEMVERVAKEIAPKCWAAYGKVGIDGSAHGNRRTASLRHARAAIAVMREPTKQMIEASNREWDGRMSHRSSGAWQAMIDAALK